VICSKNRVPRLGSKIYYPVSNPGNWYAFLTVFGLNTDDIHGNHTTCDLCGEVLRCKESSASSHFVEERMQTMHI